MGLSWGGVLELVERFMYIYWYGDVQYAGFVVSVKCDDTCKILFYFTFFLVQCVLSYLVSDSKVVDH